MRQTIGIADLDIVDALIFGSRESISTVSGHEADELGDDDQLLIAALQDRPRAPWREIGGATGVSESTASRRWERLRSQGHAWLSAYPARLVANSGYCWVSAAPAAHREVAVRLAAHPSTFWVEQLDGDRTYFVGIGAPSLRGLHALADEFAALPGVSGVRLQATRSVLHDGSVWLPRLAGPVDQAHPIVWRADAPTPAAPSETDLRLYAALLRDARASYTELAEATGLSDRTLRRRLPEMLRTGLLSTRCDVSRESVGLHAGVFLSVRWTARWQTLVGVASRIPGARMVAGVSGAAPFLLHFWMRSVSEADRVLAALQAAVPDLDVERIDFSVRAVKRYGRYFGPDGRVSGDLSAVPGADFFAAAAWV